MLCSALVTLSSNQIRSDPLSESGQVLAISSEFLPEATNLLTASRFTYQLTTETETLPFLTKTIKDPDLEYGTEEVIQEGQTGKLSKIIKITSYNGWEIGRGLVNVDRQEPAEKRIAQGTKIIIRETETPNGKIRYKAKFSAWATSYDGRCPGCRGLTFSGTPVRQGTIAVDPQLIPLGTNLYVPGYGFGRAEDIGGAIKGPRVDLGFADTGQAGWTSHWVDIYLLEP